MKRPFVPGFLKKSDTRLLLNKPDTWSTRVHLVLWYSLLFCGLLVLLFLFFPFDARDYSSVATWSSLTGILCFIGLIVWLIFLLRFNVFKRFGIQKRGDGLKTFLLFFVGMCAIVFPAYVPSIIESARTSQQYKKAEVIKDINEINKKICQLEYNILPLKWKADTLKLVEYKYVTSAPSQPDEAVVDSVAVASPVIIAEQGWTRIDTGELRQKLEYSDSLVKLKDSLYIEYTCPDYVFVDADDMHSNHIFKRRYRSRDFNKELTINNSIWIYYNLLKNFTPVKEKEKTLNELKVLLAKYRYVNPYGYTTSYSDDYNKLSYLEKINQKYQTYDVNTGLRNICDKKYRWNSRDLPVYLRFFFYIAFTLTILLFIFRHGTIKAFFLSFLVVIVLSILSGIMIAFSNGDEKSFFAFCLFYYVLFGIIALVQGSTTRSTVKGIALYIFTFVTPYVPILITGFYYAILRASYRENYDNMVYRRMFRHEELHLFIAEIAGIVLFIILLGPLFKRLYRKWYALPEN